MRDPETRAAAGRDARKQVPPESHAEFAPAAGRPDPVSILQAQDAGRLPELVPIRHGRMSLSPFTFLRGSAAVMAADLATTPTTGLGVQLCGDAHLMNFGLFGSPERRLVFDINDFDETAPGPWEWDVKRLAASLAVAGRDNGLGRKTRRTIMLAMAERYRVAMAEFAAMRDLDVWYARADSDNLAETLGAQLDKVRRKQIDKLRTKAMTRDSLQAYKKLAAVVDERPRIIADPPLVVPVSDLLPEMDWNELADRLRGLLGGYRESLAEDRRHLFDRYEFVDMARKVVGVGSVGTRCWIVLMTGRDKHDPLLLQVKEAGQSVVSAEPADNEGRRVVSGQRLMQAVSDIFLGWHRVSGFDGQTRDFYVRQLRDWKGAAVVEEMDQVGLRAYAALCGWTLARAHARTGDRIAIAAYLGTDATFDNAIADFAEKYADQTERDHAALTAAVRDGRVQAQEGI
ncbi:DUF2252 domain-containing protein [Paractinoplanes globisporus]|uniref:DUF2252 domain-containing protein n=1 Tax=Paractinoplanes globisporus TaxID=113565 RepID=A0ABW6WRM2_9ACTN|nr:DUF2252 domain-containing protein [Actinoplanes globisporus]